jgi:hypothetical protein
LLVDSTGLKLCGAGERLVEKHGARRRRTWRNVDDGDLVNPLLDQVAGSQLPLFIADGLRSGWRLRHGRRTSPRAAVIVPPRNTAVPSGMAVIAPKQRDRHL